MTSWHYVYVVISVKTNTLLLLQEASPHLYWSRTINVGGVNYHATVYVQYVFIIGQLTSAIIGSKF